MPYSIHLRPLFTKLHAWWQRQLDAANHTAPYLLSQDEDEHIRRENQARAQLRAAQALARWREATAKGASHVDSKGQLHGLALEGGV